MKKLVLSLILVLACFNIKTNIVENINDAIHLQNEIEHTKVIDKEDVDQERVKTDQAIQKVIEACYALKKAEDQLAELQLFALVTAAFLFGNFTAFMALNK